MDKLINNHIDDIEKLAEELDAIIDNAIDNIDIRALVKDPTAELQKITDEIKEIFIEKYAPQAVELGFDFAKRIQEKIEKDKPIKINDSNNPNLNKDEKAV